MKESHKAEIESLSDKMEKEALKRLNQASRKALEENTMLLRQVSLLGSNLATTESSLTASKYHNQGLKALLQKTEHKCAELAKQYAVEKQVTTIRSPLPTVSFFVSPSRRMLQKRKERTEMEAMLRDKSSRCDHLERERSKWSTELLQLRQEHNELRQEHGHCRQRIAELCDSLDRCKASLSKAEKESALLSKAVITAKQMMTAFLTVLERVAVAGRADRTRLMVSCWSAGREGGAFLPEPAHDFPAPRLWSLMSTFIQRPSNTHSTGLDARLESKSVEIREGARHLSSRSRSPSAGSSCRAFSWR